MSVVNTCSEHVVKLLNAVNLNPLNEAMKMSEEVECRCMPWTPDRWQHYQNWNLETRTRDKYSLKKCCGLMLADEHCPQQVCFYDADNE